MLYLHIKVICFVRFAFLNYVEMCTKSVRRHSLKCLSAFSTKYCINEFCFADEPIRVYRHKSKETKLTISPLGPASPLNPGIPRSP